MNIASVESDISLLCGVVAGGGISPANTTVFLNTARPHYSRRSSGGIFIGEYSYYLRLITAGPKDTIPVDGRTVSQLRTLKHVADFEAILSTTRAYRIGIHHHNAWHHSQYFHHTNSPVRYTNAQHKLPPPQ